MIVDEEPLRIGTVGGNALRDYAGIMGMVDMFMHNPLIGGDTKTWGWALPPTWTGPRTEELKAEKRKTRRAKRSRRSRRGY